MRNAGYTSLRRTLAVALLSVSVLLAGVLIALGDAHTANLAASTPDQASATETATATAESTASPTPTSGDAGTPTGTALAPPLGVLAVWQLPDMQPDAPGIQYGTLSDPEQHDDDMFLAGVQVAPNIDDQPEPRKIEYWLAVELPGGIESATSIDVTAYGPDGRIHEDLPLEEHGCADLGSLAMTGSMLEAAVHTGQLEPDEVDRLAGCEAGIVRVFRGVGALPESAPPGEYRVVALVVDQSGAAADGASTFEALSVVTMPETTPTPLPEPTAGPTEVIAPTATPIPISTVAPSPTLAPSPTMTPTSTLAPSPSPTPSPTPISSPTATAAALPTSAATLTPTATATEPPTAGPTMTPAPVPTATPTATATAAPSATPTATATVAPSSTSIPTPAPTESINLPPPSVLAVWQLPDMQPGVDGIQYGTAGNPEQHDDDILQSGIQVAPVLDDQPEPRRIEHWLVAELEGGIERVTTALVTVYGPDGSFHAELSMEPRSCQDLAISLAAAVDSGQLNPNAADQVASCDAGTMAAFRGLSDLPVSAPAGQYRVVGLVIDDHQESDSSSSVFESLPVLGLDVGSNRVSFGEISPGGWYPATTSYTVRNTGNVAGYIYLEFSAMVGASSGEVISEFGAVSDTEQLMPVATGEPICFAQQLPPNESRALILYVRPGAVPDDEYAGKLSLSIRASCTP